MLFHYITKITQNENGKKQIQDNNNLI